MNKVSRSYQDDLLKALADPAEAAAYLNAALDDGSDQIFMLALRNVAEARRLSSLSEIFHKDTEVSELMLSDNGAIQLSDLSEIFLGIRFVAQKGNAEMKF